MGKKRYSKKKKYGKRRKYTSKKRRHSKGKKSSKKLAVKRQFRKAMSQLNQMTPVKQRAAVWGASNKFIHDMSRFLNKIRNKGNLLRANQRRILKKHRKKLKKLVKAKTPVDTKRLILSQKGGIIPALIPIIVALIGAGGSIATGATTAAIMKR